MTDLQNISRRKLLQAASTLAAGYTLSGCGIMLPDSKPVMAAGNSPDFWSKDRVIEMRRADTGEHSMLRFYSKGRYDRDVYKQACWFLRDAKDGNAVIAMDMGVLDLLYGLQEWARNAGVPNPLITVNSAYRTRRRNATIEGAARNSLHIQGKAVDLTMRGVSLRELEKIAKHLHVGGVGVYRTFIHVDTGRVRYWKK